jgi:hypothetical protein
MVNPDQPNRTIADGIVDTANAQDTQLYSEINSTIKGWVDDTSDPMLNLPNKVLFPTSAHDVVAAIRFAKDHGLEVREPTAVFTHNGVEVVPLAYYVISHLTTSSLLQRSLSRIAVTATPVHHPRETLF